MKETATDLNKGLHTDASPVMQPKSTYRFALNAVMESEVGDLGLLGNEESNKEIERFPNFFLSSCRMSESEIAILSITFDGLSEIGIFNPIEDTYESHVIHDLGFTKENKFDITYRLRRGCERVIYFTDNNVRPMSYNFDKPEIFKSPEGTFQKERFYLQKSYNKLPMFRRVEVIEGVGKLKTGAYFIAIQYLDEDLNPTEFANVSGRINIYQDKLTDTYPDIGGSSSIDNSIYVGQITNKALKISLFNLDTAYKFYRLALIKYNSDSGVQSEVGLTDKIPINITEYIYDGNDFTKSVIEEVQQQNFIIDKAKNVVQIENQLVFTNIGGKATDYCSLQKYASKIKSRVVVKEQILTAMNAGSPKNPTVDLFSVGYMPGEIYSFAVVYLYSDGTKSPAYHIPGITPEAKSESLPTGRYHMSADNTLDSVTYDRRDTCTNYWGTDAWGNELEGTKVRHHRFPTRGELGIGYIYKPEGTELVHPKTTYAVDVRLEAYIRKSIEDVNVPIGTTCVDEFTITLKYFLDGVSKTITDTFVVTDCNYNQRLTYELGLGDSVSNVEVTTTSKAENTITQTVSNIYFKDSVSFDKSTRFTKILGIEFTDIELPEVDGETKIVGYEIVRQERTERNKTVLDTAVLTPIIDYKNFAATAHLVPNISSSLVTKPIKINPNYRGLISPDFLFNNTEYNTPTMIHVGNYTVAYKNYFIDSVEDVQPGTSYDADINKKEEKDLDGWSLHVLTRVNGLDFETITPTDVTPKDVVYLDALGSYLTSNNDKEIFNLSSDNKTGLARMDAGKNIPANLSKLPYVYLTRSLANPYQDFLTDRFFKQQLNPTIFSSSGVSSVSLFGGDSYMTPLKYTNTYFIDVKPRERKVKKSIWKVLLGAVIAVVGVAAAVFTGGTSLALSATALTALASLGVAAVQFGLSMVSSGIKQEKMARVYQDLWDKNLKETVQDIDVLNRFRLPNPKDDEIQWMSDVLEDVWFETNFNGALRLDADTYNVTYLPPIRPLTEETANKYIINKLTNPDQQQTSGRLYKGFANAEFYQTNKDYDAVNHGKYYYALSYAYDCCSDCRENFPHRAVYSQTSFSEELTDNYKKFLPNNYKDLSGETGPINNTFVLNNRLYLHTSEALWMQPNTYQERVTNEIVSFIGTGSLFEAPAQRIIEDTTGNSAGIQHKWASVLYPYGYSFISAAERKVYVFDGKLEPISSKGMIHWFNNNITPLGDNASMNDGYLVAYDALKERLMFTKNTGEEASSWTVSYSLKHGAWISWHSYIPSAYMSTNKSLYTWRQEYQHIWKHNVSNNYQIFYNNLEPHIIEYVSNDAPTVTKVWNALTLQTQSRVYDAQTNSYSSTETTVYNKLVLYNSNQCSGELNLNLRETEEESSMMSWVEDKSDDFITIAKRERDWYINDFRDYRVKYNEPIWKDINSYNKELNKSTISFEKDWTQLEPFRDKYLNIRLIFDKFADKKIIFTIANEDMEISKH